MRRIRFLHFALAAAVVVFVVMRSHPGDLRAVLRDIDIKMTALSLLLNVPVALLAPLRSSLVFRRLGHKVPASVLIPTTIVGFVAGGLTPAASGELLRAGPLRTRAGVPFEDSMAAVVYERVLSTYLLALSTVVLFALANLRLIWGLVVVIVGAGLCLLPWLGAVKVLPLIPGEDRIGGRGLMPAIFRRVLAMAAQLRLLLAGPGLLVQWSVITAAMFALISAQYWLLARGLSEGISLNDAWLAFGVSTFAAVASLIPLGLGVLEGSLAAILDRLGMTLEQGEVVALLVRATITLPLVIAAFACYLYLQRNSEREGPSEAPDAS